jgi:hypothetical protein
MLSYPREAVIGKRWSQKVTPSAALIPHQNARGKAPRRIADVPQKAV